MKYKGKYHGHWRLFRLQFYAISIVCMVPNYALYNSNSKTQICACTKKSLHACAYLHTHPSL